MPENVSEQGIPDNRWRGLPPGVIHWSEAKNHINEMVNIYGDVKSTYFDYDYYERFCIYPEAQVTPPPTFIEIGEKYPSNRLLKIVIWGRDRFAFNQAPDIAFKDKSIIVTGSPYIYKDLATIQISSPKSIRIVDPIEGLDSIVNSNHEYDDYDESEYDYDESDDDYDYYDDSDNDYVPGPEDNPLYGWFYSEDNGWMEDDPSGENVFNGREWVSRYDAY